MRASDATSATPALRARTVRALVGLGFTAAVVIGAGGIAYAGLEGSKHDFSKTSWSAGDPCGVCHTPHSDKPPAAAPLWDTTADLNRTFGSSDQIRSFPGSGTVKCLLCHDGTIARDAVAGAVGIARRSRFVNKRHPGLFRARHGTTDHPVGVPYPQFTGKFQPISTVIAKGEVSLPDGRVECISCHDPHNTAGVPHMLVTSNARSALCLTCHKK